MNGAIPGAATVVSASLSARRRAAELDALASGAEVDLIVVGGGVTGTGVALDAASRGLSVALVEAVDLAHGTSRFSGKLAHGGLRYLAHGHLGLARESAVERDVLLRRTAPHLTRPLAQLFPRHSGTPATRSALTGAGVRAGDVLRRLAGTPSALLPRPRTVPSAEALALVPGLRAHGLQGGLLAFDAALTDDARLVVALARTAAAHGARVLTRVRATELRADRVRARDERTGADMVLRARQVVNATGVWAGALVPSVRLRPSRGAHVVLDGRAVGVTETALMVPVPEQTNRFVFLLPQPDGKVYLGLTDEPVSGPIPDVVDATESDVDFLLDVASSALDRRLSRDDVLGSFAGLRPLLDAPGHTADASREHAVLTDDDTGVVTVVGGKLTTYRTMAREAVDAAARTAGLHVADCRTHRLPLIGATDRAALTTVDAPARLVARYGTEAPRVSALADVDAELGRPVALGVPVTGAEVVWAVRHEGALDADDVLHRRTRIGLVAGDAEAARTRVGDLVTRSLRGLERPD